MTDKNGYTERHDNNKINLETAKRGALVDTSNEELPEQGNENPNSSSEAKNAGYHPQAISKPTSNTNAIAIHQNAESKREALAEAKQKASAVTRSDKEGGENAEVRETRVERVSVEGEPQFISAEQEQQRFKANPIMLGKVRSEAKQWKDQAKEDASRNRLENKGVSKL